jgi:hypothetical protein
MTKRAEDMGNTFAFAGGVDAVESDFGDGGMSTFVAGFWREGMSDVCRAFGISRKTG